MTTVPQKISSPFDNVPDDVLKLMLITLSYKEILDKCSTSKRFATICKDKTFWAEKAKRDFGVNTQTFYKKQGLPANVYLEYFVVYEVTEFLIEAFKFGMYIRGWSGQGPYPDRYKTPIHSETFLRKLSNLISIYSNSIESSKEIIEHIPISQKILKNNDKYISRSFKITGASDSNSLLQFIYSFHDVAHMIEPDINRKTAILIATVVLSLYKYGKNIQNYSISDLERMKIPLTSYPGIFSGPSWQNPNQPTEKNLIEIYEGSITQNIFNETSEVIEETIPVPSHNILNE